MFKMMKRLAGIILFSLPVFSCSLIDFGSGNDHEPPFAENNFSPRNKAIFGDTLEISVGITRLVSPEIYIGERKLDMEYIPLPDNNPTGWPGLFRIALPEEEMDGMYSGIDYETYKCRITLKTGFEEDDERYEGTIAELHLYQWRDYGENYHELTLGVPVKANLEGIYGIFLKDNDDHGSWENELIPQGVTLEGACPLTFTGEDGNILKDVQMSYIKNVSAKYIYARILFPVELDTVYTEYKFSWGEASEALYTDASRVLINTENGKVIYIGDDEDREREWWMDADSFSEDRFCIMHDYNTLEEFEVYEDYARTYDETEIPTEDVFIHGALAIDGDDMVIGNYIYLREYGRFYELILKDKPYESYDMLSEPERGGDGKVYAGIQGRRSQAMLYRIAEDDYDNDNESIWEPVGEIECDMQESFGPYYGHYINGGSGNDCFIAHKGNIETVYTIDKSGNFKEAGKFEKPEGMRLLDFSTCYNPQYLVYEHNGSIYTRHISDIGMPDELFYYGLMNYGTTSVDISGSTIIITNHYQNVCIVADMSTGKLYTLEGLEFCYDNEIYGWSPVPQF